MKRLSIMMIVLAQPALAQRSDGYGYMMDGYGYGIGMMFGPVLWLIVIGLIVAGVIWMVRRTDAAEPSGKSTNALAELDMRLARGEIDAEDYAARKKLLTS
jgi:putative membrane protein